MRGVSRELRAVVHIFQSDEELRRKALPFLNWKSGEIDWDKIFDQKFGGGHRAVINWAYSIWTAKVANQELFCSTFFLDKRLRKIILQALAIRWGLEELERAYA